MELKRPQTNRMTPSPNNRPQTNQNQTFRPKINQYTRSGAQYVSPYSQRPGSSHIDIRTRMRTNIYSDKENPAARPKNPPKRPCKTDDEVRKLPRLDQGVNQKEIDEIMRANASKVEEIIEQERQRQEREQIAIRMQHEEEITRLRQEFKKRENSLLSRHNVLEKRLHFDESSEYDDHIQLKQRELVRKESEIKQMHLKLLRKQKELEQLKAPSRRAARPKIPPPINFDSSLNYSDFSTHPKGHLRKSSSFNGITSDDFSNFNFDTSIPFLPETEDSRASSRPGTRETRLVFSKRRSRPMKKGLNDSSIQSRTWDADS